MRDDDREKYGALCRTHQGACPEWVELSSTDLVDEETGLLLELEDRRTWDMSPREFLNGFTRGKIFYLQALIWLARRKAGCRDDPYTFRPRTQDFSGVQWEPTGSELATAATVRGADADPPVPANRAARRADAKAPAKKAPARKGAASKT